MTLGGKVAVVSGGTSGIGARTAELFVEQGAQVVITGRRREQGEALAHRLGASASFIQTDVLEESQVKAMIDHAIMRFGRLDCLFNNVGGGRPGSRMAGIADLNMDEFDGTIALSLRSAVLGMKHAARVMQTQRFGSIINTASLAGLRAGLSAQSYSAAKAALIHMTRCVAIELGPYNVRVNSISPGGIATGAFAKSAGRSEAEAEQSLDRLKDYFATIQPIPRAGLPDDVAQMALFLASDASGFVTGQDFVVDGGLGTGRWDAFLAIRAEIGRRVNS